MDLVMEQWKTEGSCQGQLIKNPSMWLIKHPSMWLVKVEIARKRKESKTKKDKGFKKKLIKNFREFCVMFHQVNTDLMEHNKMIICTLC